MIEFDNVISFIENSTGDEKNGFLLWAHTYNRSVNIASLTEYYKHLKDRKWVDSLANNHWGLDNKQTLYDFLHLVADFMEEYWSDKVKGKLPLESYKMLKEWIKDNAS